MMDEPDEDGDEHADCPTCRDLELPDELVAQILASEGQSSAPMSAEEAIIWLNSL
jgi:hypothetical protein